MSNTKRCITSPLSIIELPQQISGLSGKFQYYAFEPDERVSIENMKSKVNYYESTQDSIVEVPPRFIDIAIRQVTSNYYDDTVTKFEPDRGMLSAGLDGYGAGGVYGPQITSTDTYRGMVSEIQGDVFKNRTDTNFVHSSTPGEGSLYFTQDFCQGFIRKTSGDGANATQLSKLLSSELGE